MKIKNYYAEKMGKVKSIIEAIEITQRSFRGTSTEEIVSINDLRDKSERGILNDQEKVALNNYENYRIKKLNASASEEDFHEMYKLLQVLANLSPFQEFLHPKYEIN